MIKAIYKKLVPLRTRNALIEYWRRSNTSKFNGNKKECVICKQTFSHMRSKEKRPNAECPNCGSLERTRLLYLYLQNKTNAFKSQPAILHFAPEKSLSKILKNNNPNYIDCDIDPNLASVKVDITDIQYDDQSFDMVICSHVLAHVKNEKKGIQEICRVLKPKGFAIIMTQINDTEKTLEHADVDTAEKKLAAYGQDDLYRRHGRDFASRLTTINESTVIAMDYRNQFSAEENDRYCLGDGSREMIYICGKNLFS